MFQTVMKVSCRSTFRHVPKFRVLGSLCTSGNEEVSNRNIFPTNK